MSKEYTYDIDKYTIGVDENGEDGIGMTIAKIENGGIKFLGNCYGENARCIDLLIKENQSLKKQNKILKEKYKRIYNENCILREKHNISDIGLLDENYKLKQIINKAIDYLEQKPVVIVNGEPREIYVEDDNKLLKILKGENND